MASKHFTISDNALAWLERKARENSMKPSPFLNHILMKLMEQESKQ